MASFYTGQTDYLDRLNELATADAVAITVGTLSLKADKASPTFTGTVTIPTLNLSGIANANNYEISNIVINGGTY